MVRQGSSVMNAATLFYAQVSSRSYIQVTTPRRLKRTTRVDPRKLAYYKPFHTISLDPGGTTGWAMAQYRDDTTPLEHFDQIDIQRGQIGPDTHHSTLWSFLLKNSFPALTEIVCESFEFRQHLDPNNAKHKVELISREYIGIVKLFCESYDIPLTMNTASTGKTFVTDEKLKMMGLWTPGQPHSNDALRHLIRYQSINKRMNFILDKWLT